MKPKVKNEFIFNNEYLKLLSLSKFRITVRYFTIKSFNKVSYEQVHASSTLHISPDGCNGHIKLKWKLKWCYSFDG